MIFLNFFIAAFIIKTLVLIYLSFRQQKAVLRHSNFVPKAFADAVSIEEHCKAAEYTVAKQKISRVSILLDAGILSIWLLLGGLSALEQFLLTMGLTSNSVLTGLVVIGLFSLINVIIDMPLTLYSTFVLEERFGFNRTSARTFITDMIKTSLLGIVLGGGVLFAILYLMDWLKNDLWWLWVWSLLVGLNLFMMIVFPRYIAPLFNKFTSIEDGEMKQRIEGLLKKCGFQTEAVYIMDGSKRSAHGNAYFTGIGKTKRVVFYDTLIEKLTPSQIEAVLAHELGHYALKHIPRLMFFALLKVFLGLWLLDTLLKADWFYSAFELTQTNYNALLLFVLVLPAFTFFIQPISNLLNRKFEFEADAYAVERTNGEDLRSSLLKLYADNAATLTPDVLYTMWHDSHPPASQRIPRLLDR